MAREGGLSKSLLPVSGTAQVPYIAGNTWHMLGSPGQMMRKLRHAVVEAGRFIGPIS